MIKIGIEHEFVFKDNHDNYLDFENTEYKLFKRIVDTFPYIENDDTVFDCKALEHRPKRCYIEGFERYDIEGNVAATIPKGLEIRTLPHSTVDAVIADFTDTYTQIMESAASFGLYPILTSCHPYKMLDTFQQSLNKTEMTLRTDERLARVYRSMLLHGLHVNISISDLSKEQMMDLVHKVNYYAPFIIPFSFSSSFYNAEIFEGLSFRNYSRVGIRNLARLQNRKGVDVLEFAGFDSCGDTQLLKLLLLLFKGLLLDKTLNKRALSQDAELLKRSALQGFEDKTIKKEGLTVLNAAKAALKEEGNALEDLETMLHTNDSYASRMKRTYQETGDITEAISNRYDY